MQLNLNISNCRNLRFSDNSYTVYNILVMHCMKQLTLLESAGISHRKTVNVVSHHR